MKKITLRKKLPLSVSGDLLVSDFHSAIINLVTLEVAQYEAQQSESNITDALQTAGMNGGGVFTKPSDISPANADYVMKNSVDAHLKKVQAQQIKSYTTVQIKQLQSEDLKKYKGRKVRVTKLNNEKDTFVPLFADNRSGKLRNGTYSGKSVSGIIDDISFEQNVLVVKPNFTMRTLVPNRKYFLIYPISFQTMTPVVKIDFT